eukprot:1442152-Prymnesium_polylepis.1
MVARGVWMVADSTRGAGRPGQEGSRADPPNPPRATILDGRATRCGSQPPAGRGVRRGGKPAARGPWHTPPSRRPARARRLSLRCSRAPCLKRGLPSGPSRAWRRPCSPPPRP